MRQELENPLAFGKSVVVLACSCNFAQNAGAKSAWPHKRFKIHSSWQFVGCTCQVASAAYLTREQGAVLTKA